MFRFLLLLIVVFALVVFMRLVLLRLKVLEMKTGSGKGAEVPVQETVTSRSRTIDAPAPLQVKSYMFTNFDYRLGPADRSDFYENLYINVGETTSSATNSESSPTRTYSLYVTTPKALSSAMRLNKQGYKFGRHVLVVESYDINLILRAVKEHINDLGLMAEDIT
jgi:hypothetical protein